MMGMKSSLLIVCVIVFLGRVVAIWRETGMNVRMWNVIGTMSTILSPPDARVYHESPV